MALKFLNNGYFAGKVGIGVLSPNEKLEVAGNITIAEKLIHSGDTNTYIQFPGTNDKITFSTNGSDALTLDAANSATFTGDVLVEDNLYLTDAGTVRGKIQLNSSDRDNLDIKATSLGSLMRFYTVDTLALTLDATQNAAFAGDISVIKSSASIKAEESGGADMRMVAGGSTGYIGTYSNDAVHIQQNSGAAITIDTSRNSTFAGSVTVGNKLMITSSSDYIDVISDDLYIVAADKNILYSGNAETLRLDESQNATFAGDVYIPEYIYHSGDTNTYIRFTADTQTFRTGGDDRLILTNTTATFAGAIGVGGTTPSNGYAIDITPSGGNIIRSTRGTSVFGSYQSNNSDVYLGTISNNTFKIITNDTVALTLDTSQNATFSGDITIPQYLKHTNDADTYFGFSANNQVLFHVGGSDRLIITSGGNVGIGTTSPDKKLEVSGDIKISGGDYNGLFFENASGTTKTLLYQHAGYDALVIKDIVNNADRVTFKNNGSVGIGTTSPGGNLHVVGNAGSSGQIYLSDRDNGTGTGDALLINKSGVSAFIYNRDGGQLSFGTNNVSNNLVIANTGNVGIGTTSPSAKLEVAGNTTITGAAGTTLKIEAKNDTAFNDPRIEFVTWNVASGASSGKIQLTNGTYNSNDMAFFTETSNSVTEKMRIASTGNVGIGTASPSAKLEIAGSGNQKLLINRTDGDNFFIDAQNGQIRMRGSDSIYMGVSGDLLTITNTNIGIGTTSPSAKLDVEGRVDFSNDLRLRGTDSSANQGVARFYVDSSNKLFIDTANNGSNMFVIDSSGSVGIGTASPSARLEVLTTTTNKFVRFRADNNEQRFEFYVGASGNASRMSMHNDAATETIRFSSAGNSYLNGGNVGIGTTSPETKLTIKGDALNTNQPVRITNSVTDTHTGLFLNNTGNTVGEKYGMQFGGYNQYSIGGIFGVLDSTSGSTSGDITFDMCNGTSSGSLIERMRITHEGNVGIGTSSPNQKLQVGGNLHVYDEEGDTDAAIFISTGTSNVTTVSIRSNGISYLNGGNVGIGTTSPNYKLASYSSGDEFAIVAGAGNAVGEFTGIGLSGYIATNAAVKAGLVFERETSWGIGKMHFLNNNTLGDSDATLSDSKMTIDSAGNVGIGETSPDGKLHIHQTGSGTLTTIITEDDARKIFIGRDAINCKDLSNNAALLYLNQAGGNVTISNNLGIGTTSPGVPLDVTGIIRTTTSFVGNASIVNQITAATSSGSIKFKNNSGVDRAIITDAGNVGIGTTSPAYKLTVSGGIEAGGKVTYTKQAGSLDTTGYAVAGITALPAGNGFSCGFTFTCFGFTNYQKIVYSCYNAGGTWYAKKLIDEGTDKLDVVASADGSTITFTYKTRSGTVSYTPKVTVEAIGTSINSTYA